MKRVSYPIEIKLEAVKMKSEGKSDQEIMERLCIKNRTQINTWYRWHKNGEDYRFNQPVGKQYSYGKGPEGLSKEDKLEIENKYLKNKIMILEKYKKLERKWCQKYL